MSTKKALASAIGTTEAPQALAATSHGVLITGTLSGHVEVLTLGDETASTRMSAGTGSVRALLAPDSGHAVAALSGGAVTILDLESGSVVRKWEAAADRSPTALFGFNGSASDVGFVGDEAGGVLRVDARVKSPVAHALEHGDYISALAVPARTRTDGMLIAASGDGTLGLYDTRAGALKLARVSAAFDDDLTCLAVAPGAVLAGTLEGALHAFDVAHLQLPDGENDVEIGVRRLRGHPETVNAVVMRGDVAITACADGLLRVVAPADGSLLGVLDYDRSWVQTQDKGTTGGKRARDVRWPIEAMAVIHDADGVEMLALAGHEECVRFASLSILDESDEEDGESAQGNSRLIAPPAPEPKSRKKQRGKKRGKEYAEAKDDTFFGDL